MQKFLQFQHNLGTMAMYKGHEERERSEALKSG